MTDKDRIRLAEAMGWTDIKQGQLWVGGLPPKYRENPDLPGYLERLPDPFTDANDDYAVLEWMRNGDGKRYVSFQYALLGLHADYSCYAYRVGDYARAALRVLHDD